MCISIILRGPSTRYAAWASECREGHFRVAVNLNMKARLNAKAFDMKISFVCISMKTNSHNKNLCT